MLLRLMSGSHPHGFVSMGAFGNFATEGSGFGEKFPGITNSLLTLNGNFRLPVYKEYMQALGMASVSRRSCEALLYCSHFAELTEGKTDLALRLQLLSAGLRNRCTRDLVLWN